MTALRMLGHAWLITFAIVTLSAAIGIAERRRACADGDDPVDVAMREARQ
jgi:hypothetical protein